MPNNHSKLSHSSEYFPVQGSEQLIQNDYLINCGFAVNSGLRLFICIVCKTGHSLKSIERHFEQHKGLKKRMKLINLIAKDLDIHSEWPPFESYTRCDDPMIGVPRWDGIKVEDRKGCLECPFSTFRDRSMKDHYATAHPEVLKPSIFPKVPTQELNSGKSTGVFRVEPMLSEPLASDGLASDKLMQEFLQDDWTLHVSKQVIDSRRVTAWLKRTNWHLHVHGLDPKHLKALVSLPDDTEFPRLRQLILDYAHAALNESEQFSAYVLKRLNTADPSTGLHHSPFQRPQKDETITQYTVIITNFVASLLRTSDVYKFPLSDSLEKEVNELRTLISANPAEPVSKLVNALHGVFVALWHTDYRQNRNVSFPDPTVCFLILHALKDDGSFIEPKELTHPLRQLIWFITIVAIREMVAMKNANEVDLISEALEDLDEYIREGRETTFSELWGLQHFASFYAFNTPTFPHIWWRDRPAFTSMLFRGQLINLEHIQQAIRDLQVAMMKLWKDKICFGKDIQVDLDELHDDLSNVDVNYSFMNHPGNINASYNGILFNTIATDPDLYAKCFYRHPDGHYALKPSVANTWLANLAKLELHLLASFQLLGGAPPRFTEVCSTLLYNSPLMRRNLYAVGHQFALVVQYTKTSHNKGRDSLIPHAFDAFGGDLLRRIHTVARPFARAIIRTTRPLDADLLVKYATFVFMGDKQEIQSHKLKDLFKLIFKPIVGWDVTPSKLRHILIGLGRMHCDSIEHLEERMAQEESVRAQQSGHSRSTERRIYGLDVESVGAADFNTLSRMLDVSVTFQLLFRAVPAGGRRWLSFEEAFCDNFDTIVASDFLPERIRHYISPSQRSAGSIPTMLIADMRNRMNEVIEPIVRAVDDTKVVVTQIERNTSTVLNVTEETHSAIAEMQDSIARIERMLSGSSGIENRQLDDLPATGTPVPSNRRMVDFRASPENSSPVIYSQSPPSSSPGDQVIVFDDIQPSAPLASGAGGDNESPQSSPLTVSQHFTLGNILVPTVPEIIADDYRSPSKSVGKSRARVQAIAVSPAKSVTTAQSSDSALQSVSKSIGIPRPLANQSQTVKSRAKILTNWDALATLRQLLGNPEAVWRSEQQRLATEAIVKCETDVLFLVRTGGGKTIPVVIAALSSRGIFIVVCGWISLMVDWMVRLERMNVKYEVYDPTLNKRPSGMAPIMLVSSDRFRTPGFQRHMARIAVTNFIRCVVLDEFHAWLPDNSFRKRVFSHLDWLRFEPFQLVLMTATLPLSFRDVVAERAALRPDFKIISNSIIRPEIKLGVTKPFNIHNPVDIQGWCSLMFQLFDSVGGKKDIDRVIIYCRSLAQLKVIQSKLNKHLNMNIPLYYTGNDQDHMSAEQQADSLKRWRENPDSWILLCTNAFSAGVDEPNVRIVFHYGIIRDFIDTVQEQDRAGRSGSDAFAYIIPPLRPTELRVSEEAMMWGGDIRGHEALRDVVYRHTTQLPDACLNYARGHFFNGVGYLCRHVAGLKRTNWCNRCDALDPDGAVEPLTDPSEYAPCSEDLVIHSATVKETKDHLSATFGTLSEEAVARALKARTDMDQIVAQMDDLLGRLLPVCSACWAWDGRESSYHHIRDECPIPKQVISGRQILNRIWLDVRFPPKVYACFKCYAAGLGSNRLHPDFKQKLPCPYSKCLLVGLAFVVYCSTTHRDGFLQFAGIDNWTDDDQFISWLSAPDAKYVNSFMLILKYFVDFDNNW